MSPFENGTAESYTLSRISYMVPPRQLGGGLGGGTIFLENLENILGRFCQKNLKIFDLKFFPNLAHKATQAALGGVSTINNDVSGARSTTLPWRSIKVRGAEGPTHKKVQYAPCLCTSNQFSNPQNFFFRKYFFFKFFFKNGPGKKMCDHTWAFLVKRGIGF